jgi:hypothetical protein
MSIIERSLSRGRTSGLVRDSFLLELHGRLLMIVCLSAPQYSNPQAVVARATTVLCPESSGALDPRISRTLAAEIPSLLAIPMRYAIILLAAAALLTLINPR